MRRQYARLAATCACAAATALFCGAALADPGNGNSANAPGQQKHEQAPAPTPQPAPAPAAQPAQQQQATPPGQAKKQAATPATQSSPGQAKQEAKASGAGVKPANDTTKWTSCRTGNASGTTCTSNDAGHTPQSKPDVSKQYGNGKTAAQIAVSRGGVGVTLKGPGNSQPHKVSLCGKPSNKSGGVDVHAVKSYDASACAPQAQSQAPAVTKTETHVCGQTTVTTSSTQVVGVLHHEHLISPNEHSAHYTKHGDQKVVETTLSTQVVPTGESCSSAQPVQPLQPIQPVVPVQPVQPTPPPAVVPAPSTPPANSAAAAPQAPSPNVVAAAPATQQNGNVLGAQTKLAAPKAKKSNGGVLGTVTKVAGSTLPFTGFPVWLAVLVAVTLILAGTALVRRRGADARL